MVVRKITTKPARFRIEEIDGRYAIFDTAAWTYKLCEPHATRSAAEREVRYLNQPGVDGPTLPKYGTRRRRIISEFQARSPHFLCGTDGVYRIHTVGFPEVPTREPVIGAERRRLIDHYKSWLPALLKNWATELAAEQGYTGNRSQWATSAIVSWLRAEPFYLLGSQAEPAVAELHLYVAPLAFEDDTDANLERREALAVHYLSTDTSASKAGFLGMSKATYFRLVDAGHRLVARRWLS